MTSVQSWLLLPSSWSEDEHSYPALLGQGSEQPVLQPLDQATSVPSRGERALSQVVCSSHLHSFMQLWPLQMFCRLARECLAFSLSMWSRQQKWLSAAASLWSDKHGASTVLLMCQTSLLLFFFSSFDTFSKNQTAKWPLLLYLGPVRKLQSTWNWGFDAFW